MSEGVQGGVLTLEDYVARAKPMIDEAMEKIGGQLQLQGYALSQIQGGKRLRGTLCLLTCDALGESRKRALSYAAAVELVHCGTLVHDDYVDGHKQRRGRKALHAALDPRRAVLLGDILMSASSRHVRSEDGSMSALSEAVYNTARGALMEPLDPEAFLKGLMSDEARGEVYEVMIRMKTAELFGTASKLGAIAAGASEQLQEDAYRFGIHCGMAFQVADDLVDLQGLFGGGHTTPDYVISTLPMVGYFLHKDQAVKLLNGIIREVRRLDNPSSSTSGSKASELFTEEELGLAEAVVQEASKFVRNECRDAAECLKAFPMNNHSRSLEQFPAYCVDRLLREPTSMTHR